MKFNEDGARFKQIQCKNLKLKFWRCETAWRKAITIVWFLMCFSPNESRANLCKSFYGDMQQLAERKYHPVDVGINTWKCVYYHLKVSKFQQWNQRKQKTDSHKKLFYLNWAKTTTNVINFIFWSFVLCQHFYSDW